MAVTSFAPVQVKAIALASLAAGLLIGSLLGLAYGLHRGSQSVAEVSGVYEKALVEVAQIAPHAVIEADVKPCWWTPDNRLECQAEIEKALRPSDRGHPAEAN